jgi:hypothetical protein
MATNNGAINPLTPLVLALLAELERAQQEDNENREIALQIRQGALIIAAACARWGGLDDKPKRRRL